MCRMQQQVTQELENVLLDGQQLLKELKEYNPSDDFLAFEDYAAGYAQFATRYDEVVKAAVNVSAAKGSSFAFRAKQKQLHALEYTIRTLYKKLEREALARTPVVKATNAQETLANKPFVLSRNLARLIAREIIRVSIQRQEARRAKAPVNGPPDYSAHRVTNMADDPHFAKQVSNMLSDPHNIEDALMTFDDGL